MSKQLGDFSSMLDSFDGILRGWIQETALVEAVSCLDASGRDQVDISYAASE